jgi:hypothetical protein
VGEISAWELSKSRRRSASIRLRPNKTRLKIDYQPASASFGGPVTLTANLPDVTRTTATLDRLRNLAEQCSQELDRSPPPTARCPSPKSAI